VHSVVAIQAVSQVLAVDLATLLADSLAVDLATLLAESVAIVTQLLAAAAAILVVATVALAVPNPVHHAPAIPAPQAATHDALQALANHATIHSPRDGAIHRTHVTGHGVDLVAHGPTGLALADDLPYAVATFLVGDHVVFLYDGRSVVSLHDLSDHHHDDRCSDIRN